MTYKERYERDHADEIRKISRRQKILTVFSMVVFAIAIMFVAFGTAMMESDMDAGMGVMLISLIISAASAWFINYLTEDDPW